MAIFWVGRGSILQCLTIYKVKEYVQTKKGEKQLMAWSWVEERKDNDLEKGN